MAEPTTGAEPGGRRGRRRRAADDAGSPGASQPGAADDVEAPGPVPSDAEDLRPGETKKQAAARRRREKREAGKKKRAQKMAEAEFHGKETDEVVVVEEKRTTGAWADDDCGGFPPLFGMCHADRLYVDDDPFPDPAAFLRRSPAPPVPAAPAAPPPPPPPQFAFFDDDGTDTWHDAHSLEDLEQMRRVVRRPDRWAPYAPPWDETAQKYVYGGPALYSSRHATVPQLIEAGDVDLLRALRRCGHLPGGLAGSDDLGLTPAYLAVHFDRPAVLDFLREDGVDLTVACDGSGEDAHGTPAFYAAFHGKVRILEALCRLGVAMEAPCTRMGETPADFFERHGPAVAAQLRAAARFRHKCATTLARFLWMAPPRRFLGLARRYARLLQGIYRGVSVRKGAADLAMALVKDRRQAAAAAEAARLWLEAEAERLKYEDSDGEEKVLSLAEAMAQEEKEEAAEAVRQLNAGREELPGGWVEMVDPDSGQPYYFREVDGHTSWERPGGGEASAARAEIEDPDAMPEGFGDLEPEGPGDPDES